MSFSFQYLIALIATVLVEFIIVAALVRKDYLKIFFYFVLINSFSFPIANYFYQCVLSNLLIIEVSVFLVEIPLIKLLLETKFYEALLLSLAANIASALLGIFLFLDLFV